MAIYEDLNPGEAPVSRRDNQVEKPVEAKQFEEVLARSLRQRQLLQVDNEGRIPFCESIHDYNL
jgi:hypothetical protein